VLGRSSNGCGVTGQASNETGVQLAWKEKSTT